jgi:hypothetical protein
MGMIDVPSLSTTKSIRRIPMPQQNSEEVRRVSFDRSIPAHIVAIDGTWKRECMIRDVSDIDATLMVDGPVDVLSLNEFFLLLSSSGLAYRRCQLDRVNGSEVKVSFLRQRGKQQKPPTDDS